MTQFWMDGFDHYGADANTMLDGAWEEFVGDVSLGDITLVAPIIGARTGSLSLRLGAGTTSLVSTKRPFDVLTNEIFAGLGVYIGALPASSSGFFPIQMQTNADVAVATVTISPTGAVEVRQGDHTGAILGSSAPATIAAGKWNHIEVHVVANVAAGIFEVRVDEVSVLSLTGLNLGAEFITKFVTGINTSAAGVNNPIWVDDIVTGNNGGLRNNTFRGAVKVATLFSASNGPLQEWDAFINSLPVDVSLAFQAVGGNPPIDADFVTGDDAALPTSCEFIVNDLPADVTRVSAVAVVGRNFKNACDLASMEISFVANTGSRHVGLDRLLTTTPTYYEDTFETDPDTGLNMTPGTILNSRIRLDRTL